MQQRFLCVVGVSGEGFSQAVKHLETGEFIAELLGRVISISSYLVNEDCCLSPVVFQPPIKKKTKKRKTSECSSPVLERWDKSCRTKEPLN